MEPLLVVEEARVITVATNEFQSLLDENTIICCRVVLHANIAVSPRLKVAKAPEIDYNR